MNQVSYDERPPEMRPEAVGARLRLLREAAGLTGAELCRRLRINRGSYSNFEQGKRAAPEHLKARLADFYGTTLDYLSRGRITQPELDTLLDRLQARR